MSRLLLINSFQSFTIFPVIKAKKQFGEYGPWIIEVAILKEFLFYSYRFFLPTYFLTYQKDFELEIKLQFIQSYSNESLQKIFYSHQILEQYKNLFLRAQADHERSALVDRNFEKISATNNS